MSGAHEKKQYIAIIAILIVACVIVSICCYYAGYSLGLLKSSEKELTNIEHLGTQVEVVNSLDELLYGALNIYTASIGLEDSVCLLYVIKARGYYNSKLGYLFGPTELNNIINASIRLMNNALNTLQKHSSALHYSLYIQIIETANSIIDLAREIEAVSSSGYTYYSCTSIISLIGNLKDKISKLSILTMQAINNLAIEVANTQ